ncbi:bifunctional hydroxymethylpyrimidine kinase/phosphomethylpyrimidine kinase [Methanofollis aquaemaris]|uniref:Bifunctional hydroxymethylpyrimidine kinase/phosphomethylpyrimidine kinase n=1 Tax=Methanofollis aquaemaris TaxID=126734 RepID=A0A8A3S363_9EURY|nr:bifunctional hydroxymethylpyrimidine kinase/phosphomethylpyrimidine kinase [Methanofollis aquaemaris]QSZ66707.1 bifunctional hydroxymethylpyrimidine kinase/phosphomethylpyrimidine kinase [Methanofollis aquaemaris]
MDTPFCACTIAGSDSGGGAGIQADLATFAAFGVWGTSTITAVTAQNPGGVRGSWPLPPEAVAVQIEAVTAGFRVGAFKTGMLADASGIRAVAASLPAGVPVVVDPVMVATSGTRLLSEDAVEVLLGELIPGAAVVTPNLPEAAVLTGVEIDGPETMREAGRSLLAMGAGAVVVKGGHLPGEPADLLMDRDGEVLLTGQRHPYAVHGTGCCFSAALAASLARGMSVREAFVETKGFIDGAIVHAVPDLAGRRSVNPLWRCGMGEEWSG